MRRFLLCCLLVLMPTQAFAHDAFGDLGPFYSSFLHPLADPLQGALIIGTAAFLASRTLDAARIGLPAFLFSSAASYILFGWFLGLAASPVLLASLAVIAGLSSALPEHWVPAWMGVLIVSATGAGVGLAPGAPPTGSAPYQAFLGTLIGIAVLATLVWAGLDSGAKRISWIVPLIAGSWVAAVGILVAAFSI